MFLKDYTNIDRRLQCYLGFGSFAIFVDGSIAFPLSIQRKCTTELGYQLQYPRLFAPVCTRVVRVHGLGAVKWFIMHIWESSIEFMGKHTPGLTVTPVSITDPIKPSCRFYRLTCIFTKHLRPTWKQCSSQQGWV